MANFDGMHPHPEALLTFCAKMARELPNGRHYVARTANMIREKYPASAPSLLPELRAIYRAAK